MDYYLPGDLWPSISSNHIRHQWFWDDDPTAYVGANGYMQSMGMEVFTVAGGDDDPSGWKRIADDLPYPADTAQAGRSVGGFMFWFLTKHIEHDRPRPRPRGILHLSLADEKFGITGLPDSLEEPSSDDVLALDVLRGRELCLTAWTKDEIMPNIWTLLMVGEGALILMTSDDQVAAAVEAASLYPDVGPLPSDGYASSLQQRGWTRTTPSSSTT
jgi:hypothetical protein